MQTLEELLDCDLESATPRRIARICEIIAQRHDISREDIVPNSEKFGIRCYGFPDWCEDEHRSKSNAQIIKDFEAECDRLVTLSGTAPDIVEYSLYTTRRVDLPTVPENLVLHRKRFYRKAGEPIHNLYMRYNVSRSQLSAYVQAHGGDPGEAPSCRGHQYFWNQPIENRDFDRQRWADELGDVHG